RLRVLSEDGREVRAVSTGFAGIFVISVAPTTGGGFRVETTVAKAARAQASLTISLETAPAGDGDFAALLEAEQLFLQAQRLRSEPRASAIRQAIELFQR